MSTNLDAQGKSKGLKTKQQADPLNLQKVAERSAPKDEIIHRIERDKTLDEQRRVAARKLQFRARLRAAALLLLSVVAASGIYYYFSIYKPPTPPVAGQRGVTVTVEQPTSSDNYIQRKAAVTVPGTGTFDVQAYDFYSNKFLRGKEVMTDPQALRGALAELQSSLGPQSKLRNSWVLVFAGASFEGNADDNMTLCNRRVNAIICMMSKEMGISGLGYWKVPAGEYKSGPQNGPPLSDKEESDLAKALDANDLASQRRLIVLFISPREAVPPNSGERIVDTVSDALYDHELLPTGYKLHRARPALVNESALNCAATPPLR